MQDVFSSNDQETKKTTVNQPSDTQTDRHRHTDWLDTDRLDRQTQTDTDKWTDTDKKTLACVAGGLG